MINPLDTFEIGTLKIGGPKWYDVDTDKLTTVKDIGKLLSALSMKVSDDYENFDEVKQFLIIPEEPKTSNEIQQELNEKIDGLIEQTKRNFYASKLTAERNYEYQFDRIFNNFDFAIKNGRFMPKLIPGTLTGCYPISSGGTELTSKFALEPDGRSVGYYEISDNTKFWLNKKPNWIVRNCAKILLGLVWRDS